jgi:hypothetical protein
MMLLLVITGLVAELLTLFMLWPQGLLIAFVGATLAGVLAMMGTGIFLSVRRKESSSISKTSD